MLNLLQCYIIQKSSEKLLRFKGQQLEAINGLLTE